MATHYSILARRISWTDEPGELQSMGSQRVGHNRALTYTHMNLCQYLLPPATFESSCSFTFFFLNFWVCSGHLMVFSLNFPENPNQKKIYIYRTFFHLESSVFLVNNRLNYFCKIQIFLSVLF